MSRVPSVEPESTMMTSWHQARESRTILMRSAWLKQMMVAEILGGWGMGEG